MALASLSLSTPPRPLPTLSPHHLSHQLVPTYHPIFHLTTTTFPSTLKSSASRRPTNTYNDDNRRWATFDFNGYDYNDDEDEEDIEEEEDRSLDLLLKFVENIFRKVSKRARKAVRSVLPVAISTKLVGFGVNGMIILSFLWVLKAFLEVVCTLGSIVFVSILLIRGVWSSVLYLQESRSRHMNGFDDDPPSWTGAQPVT